jgi:CopG-like RHH_1 or ribbon-helix-helix domain, RHH_5
MVWLDPHSEPSFPFRSSKRLSITVAQSTLEALEQRSSREGRSLSNLAAYLLESALEQRSR